MSLATNVSTANDTGFRGRVIGAAVEAAVAISAEGSVPGDPAARRRVLAYAVLNQPRAHEDRFVWALLSSSVVSQAGALTTDGVLRSTVASVWDALAGVSLP